MYWKYLFKMPYFKLITKTIYLKKLLEILVWNNTSKLLNLYIYYTLSISNICFSCGFFKIFVSQIMYVKENNN